MLKQRWKQIGFFCLLVGLFACERQSVPVQRSSLFPLPGRLSAGKTRVHKTKGSPPQKKAFRFACTRLLSQWRLLRETAPALKQKKRFLRALGRCERWSLLFTEVLAIDWPSGFSPLRWLEEEGLDIELAFVHWLHSAQNWETLTPQYQVRGLTSELSKSRVAHRVFQWLLQKNMASTFCVDVMAPLQRTGPLVRREFLWFLHSAGCKGSLSLFRSQLSHSYVRVRIQACKGLGRLGTEADLFLLQQLATRDEQWIQHDQQRVYPVRKACRQAYERLQRRLKDKRVEPVDRDE